MRPQLDHQKKICHEVQSNPKQRRWGLFCEPGTGKTKTALDIANLIRSNYDNMIIFAPKGLLETWRKEMQIEDYDLPCEFMPYSLVSAKKANELVINERTLIALDESHFIKNPSSKRSRYFTRLLKKENPYVLSLTGTPDPRNILDWWIQCYILKAWTGGFELNYKAFSYAYAVWKEIRLGTGMVISKFIGEKNRELMLQGFKGKAFFIRKQDVLDLPEKNYEVKYYPLTSEQKRYLKELKKDALSQVELTQEYINASMHNFLAVCSGFVMADFDSDANKYTKINSKGKVIRDAKLIELNKNPKLELLGDIIESMPDRQLIIFCSYHKETEMVVTLVEKLNISYGLRSGRKTVDENEEILQKFKDNSIQILIATVQSTSVGLTMTNCDTIIYYNNTHDLMHRLQSEDRIHRIGQKNRCLYIDLVADGAPDHLLLQNLQMKKSNVEETFKSFLKRV